MLIALGLKIVTWLILPVVICLSQRLSHSRPLEGTYLLDKKPMPSGSLVIHDNFTNRMALRRRWFIQISALSTFDGRIVAYHGFNG
ncbi:hypothetical protein FN846DRAFT_652799 [Sphaerosporella brunnea]|uniref:Uncharacterized protein n=1 Tax=Sphaerosporella brunnea TaxID=1250544 RepID=A0A5J5EBM1_9PEZI|nr:hypothetical protein FN846DRAFT_652799 [Sphaerosporella brunnea]